ncbi:ABC transporter substrate-binding protein [Amycolatopsis sp. GM8]|uniref:ABC transporter substrate-binding protein n=1 Tax=Amycolatopsis sp. GM8 TaxID=2896530 RepID=UPI001F332277|nr:ABC transporter substrate-binding protein [Amycolatopsis sp. GM8]
MNFADNINRRGFLTLSGGVAAAGLLAACGSPTANQNTGGTGFASLDAVKAAAKGQTVSIVYPNNPGFDSTLKQVLGSAFTAETGVTVKLVGLPSNSYDDVTQRIQTDLTAGQVDDLALIGLQNVRTYADAKLALPLDPFLTLSPGYRDQLYPTFATLGKRSDTTYAIPFCASVLIMYYNADQFARAGLDPANPPRTFSEVRAAAAKLVDAKIARYGAVVPYDSEDIWPHQTFLSSAGGSFMSQDEKSITFDSSTAIANLDFWVQLTKAGHSAPLAAADAQKAFLSGELAMFITSSAQVVSTKKGASFSLKTAKTPIPDGGTLAAPAAGAGIVVLTKDANKQAAAWQVVEALTGKAGSTAQTMASGYLPVNKAAAEDPAGLGKFLNDDPLRAAAASEVPAIVPWYQFPGTNTAEISKALQDAVLAATSGKKTAADALHDAAKQAGSLLPR